MLVSKANKVDSNAKASTKWKWKKENPTKKNVVNFSLTLHNLIINERISFKSIAFEIVESIKCTIRSPVCHSFHLFHSKRRATKRKNELFSYFHFQYKNYLFHDLSTNLWGEKNSTIKSDLKKKSKKNGKILWKKAKTSEYTHKKLLSEEENGKKRVINNKTV